MSNIWNTIRNSHPFHKFATAVAGSASALGIVNLAAVPSSDQAWAVFSILLILSLTLGSAYDSGQRREAKAAAA